MNTTRVSISWLYMYKKSTVLENQWLLVSLGATRMSIFLIVQS